MSPPLNQNEFQERAQELDALVHRVQSLEDESARNAAVDLLRSLMDLHGTVVGRIVELLEESGDQGRILLDKLASDPSISGLLVLYGLHPLDLATRVARAVEKVRPRMESHGGSVELISARDAEVRIRIQATGHGCSSSGDALKTLVEQAIYEAAPEVAAVTVEGVAAAAPTGFVPLASLQPIGKENTYEEPAA